MFRRCPHRLSLGVVATLAAGAALFGTVGITIHAANVAGIEMPALTGRVVDQAEVLTAEDEAGLTADLEVLEKKSTDQLVVVTLRSLQGRPIEDFGYRLGRHWGIGQKGKDNGVLLIVVPAARKVRIEVGRGLEPVLTDAVSRLIIENAILPRFKAGDLPGGIKAGVRDIADVLTGDVEAVKLRSRARQDDDQVIVFIIFFIFWLFIAGIVIWNIVDAVRNGTAGKGGGWSTGSSGGSSGGGWSGGGGFSGGGGGFGGGGASGGW
ncbi:MAG: TPM domain-containing protein [Methyloligellaceae bacterium]